MDTARRWWTFAVVSLALFMAMVDNLVVTTALPMIKRALGAGVGDLEWILNAYTLAFAVLMIPAVALGDRFGRRRMLLLGVALFTGGSAAAALATSALALTLARAVQGAGGACITPLTLTILTGAYPVERRPAAIGLWSGVSGLGLAAGPLVGGVLVSGWGWSAAFWVNVPIGLLVLVLGRLRLEESYGDRRPLDLPGTALIGAGLTGLVYGLVRGNARGWGSAEIAGSLVAGVLLIGAFLLRERRTAHPMLDLPLFRARGFSVASAVSFLLNFGMAGAIFLLTLFIQTVLGFSPWRAGLATLPWTTAIVVVAPFAGAFAGRIGARPVVLAGLTLQTLALAWIGVLAEASMPFAELLPAFLAGGVGMGMTFAPLSGAVMGAVAEHQQGQASGAYNTIFQLGNVFGVAVLGAVFQHVALGPGDFVQGMRLAMFTGVGLVAMGVALAMALPGRTPLAAATGERGRTSGVHAEA